MIPLPRTPSHKVTKSLHQFDDAVFDELVDEMLTRIYVSRPLTVTWVLCHCDNCERVLYVCLYEDLTGGILLTFGCAERHTLLTSS
jgi:hypothetical protein